MTDNLRECLTKQANVMDELYSALMQALEARSRILPTVALALSAHDLAVLERAERAGWAALDE